MYQPWMPGPWRLAARGRCPGRLLQQLSRTDAQRPPSTEPAPSLAAALAGQLSAGWPPPLARPNNSPTRQPARS